MSRKRTFRQQQTNEYSSVDPERLLTQEPVAVYYRQSTQMQVGNVSTAIQTIDMVAELERRGWTRDKIILIDDDEGVSGTTRIDERIGMSYLFELIAERKIGAVACQDEDRLFRDMTQIQVNIFIDTCRKSNVKVITPYFIYDFTHPLQGEFHARQFRFKCDMAAEYLKSYIYGRLTSARQRILMEGKWAGASIPVGYMVDMRKQLPNGSQNPNWRKFVPFEPYAKVVREFYRVFIECSGDIRKTMYQLREQGVSFPECEPPDGFKIYYKLKHRSDGYYFNRSNFMLFLTNPAYIGHWCFRGVIQCWNNHEPLVDADTFMQAFNYLSRYTLTGEENPDFNPAYPYNPPDLDIVHLADRPLLSGLIYTQINGRWYRGGMRYDKQNSVYLYVQHWTKIDGKVLEWARRSTWIDEAIVKLFKLKVQATFNNDIWTQTLQDTQQLIERERKMKQLQLTSLNEEMQNLIISLRTLTHAYMIQEVEKRYTQMEQEKNRRETELATIEQKYQRYIPIDQARRLFERVVTEWDKMTPDERRSILALFIQRIEASDYSRAGNMTLTVHWEDGSSEAVQLWHKTRAEYWTQENVKKILDLFDNAASQLEIAAALPDLNWGQIYRQIKRHRGIVRFTPAWLSKYETYNDYVQSGGRKGRASSSTWLKEELALLRKMVERQATQLEIMKEFPFRRWIYIKERIKKLFGKGVTVPRSGILQRLTYTEYIKQMESQEQSEREESAEDALTTNSNSRSSSAGRY